MAVDGSVAARRRPSGCTSTTVSQLSGSRVDSIMERSVRDNPRRERGIPDFRRVACVHHRSAPVHHAVRLRRRLRTAVALRQPLLHAARPATRGRRRRRRSDRRPGGRACRAAFRDAAGRHHREWRRGADRPTPRERCGIRPTGTRRSVGRGRGAPGTAPAGRPRRIRRRSAAPGRAAEAAPRTRGPAPRVRRGRDRPARSPCRSAATATSRVGRLHRRDGVVQPRWTGGARDPQA